MSVVFKVKALALFEFALKCMFLLIGFGGSEIVLERKYGIHNRKSEKSFGLKANLNRAKCISLLPKIIEELPIYSRPKWPASRGLGYKRHSL